MQYPACFWGIPRPAKYESRSDVAPALGHASGVMLWHIPGIALSRLCSEPLPTSHHAVAVSVTESFMPFGVTRRFAHCRAGALVGNHCCQAVLHVPTVAAGPAWASHSTTGMAARGLRR